MPKLLKKLDESFYFEGYKFLSACEKSLIYFYQVLILSRVNYNYFKERY